MALPQYNFERTATLEGVVWGGLAPSNSAQGQSFSYSPLPVPSRENAVAPPVYNVGFGQTFTNSFEQIPGMAAARGLPLPGSSSQCPPGQYPFVTSRGVECYRGVGEWYQKQKLEELSGCPRNFAVAPWHWLACVARHLGVKARALGGSVATPPAASAPGPGFTGGSQQPVNPGSPTSPPIAAPPAGPVAGAANTLLELFEKLFPTQGSIGVSLPPNTRGQNVQVIPSAPEPAQGGGIGSTLLVLGIAGVGGYFLYNKYVKGG